MLELVPTYGGVQLFYLSRIMGTSVAQIDARTPLRTRCEEYLCGLLDDFDSKLGGADFVSLSQPRGGEPVVD